MARFAAAAATAALAVVAGGSASQAPGRIVFESDRAAFAAHYGLYTIGIDGTDRRRIVTNVDNALSALWSPDGKRIAYFQNGAFHVVPAGGGRQRIVARVSDGGDTNFSWSPDGTHIAYFDSPTPNLVIVRVDGAKPAVRRLPAGGESHDAPAWSPDGKEIAYSHSSEQRYSLNIIDVASGHLRLALKRVVAGDLAWSPDGRRIAYDYGNSVFLLDVATHARRVVVRDGYTPAWSPDGTQLSFLRLDDTYVVDLRSRRTVHISGHGTTALHVTNSPAWLPGSHRLVVSVDNDVVVADAGGRHNRLVTHNGTALELVTDPSPAPDGRRIAFVALPFIAQDNDLYSIRPDGSGVQTLTHNSVDESDPAWSPDRQRIAFVRGFSLSGDVRVMSAGGDTSHSVASGFHPTWTPDGQRLAFTRDGDIYTVDADGGGEQLLIGGPNDDFDPAWSPDGTHIAFARRAKVGAPSDVWIAAADGTGAVLVTHIGDATDACRTREAFTPTWSPDGTEIAYVAGIGVHSTCTFVDIRETIRAIHTDGSGDRLITNGGNPGEGGASDPAWSPDGTQLALSVAIQPHENDEFVYHVDVVDRDGRNLHVVARDDAQDPDWR